MKTAVLLTGNLGAFRLSMPSIMSNIIGANGDVDVYVVTSRENYVHRRSGNNLQCPVTDEDERAMRELLGPHLFLWKYIEDVPFYEAMIGGAIEDLHERSRWIDEVPSTEPSPFRENGKWNRPRWYLDQFLRLSIAAELVAKTDREYGAVMRVRPDQLFANPIIVPEGTERFLWYGHDNFFYGATGPVLQVCRDLIHVIGSVGNDRGEIRSGCDYRLGQEVQFRGWVQSQRFPISRVGLDVRWRYFPATALPYEIDPADAYMVYEVYRC